MGRGKSNVFRRAGDRPHVQLHVGTSLARGVVAVQRPRVAAIERGDPRHVRNAAVTVHVIPTRPDDAAVVRNAGIPLVAVVEAEAVDTAAVGVHVVEVVQRAGAAATQVAAASLADERQPTIGQPAGVEIVPGAVGQLLQARAVHVDLEDVVAALNVPVAASWVFVEDLLLATLAFDVGKGDLPAVGRKGG